MKKIIFYILFISLPVIVMSKSVPKEQIVKIANNWAKQKIYKYKKKKVNFEIYSKKEKEEDIFYIFNFEEGGFIIISADDRIFPILGYSYNGKFNVNKKNYLENTLLNVYKEQIVNVKKSKTENNNTKEIWFNLLRGKQLNIFNNPKYSSVPSLFETYKTSRWATWEGYNSVFPNQNGSNICVPLAMSQICKFHRHPKQGQGENSYTTYYNNGISRDWYINYSEHLFNYDLMPFRLTYCGNGTNNCDEGSFDFIPGITEENKNEISNLIFKIGLGVNQGWYGEANREWLTYWAICFSSNLGYEDSWEYWDQTHIYKNVELFKYKLRKNIQNYLPVLFRVRGHAIVIDGYEYDNFFHIANGTGGAMDGYYYLFLTDNDGIHLPMPRREAYDAILNLKPIKDFPNHLIIDTIIQENNVKCFQAKEFIIFKSIIKSNTNIAGYSKEIFLDKGFEIKKGTKFYINHEEY